MSNGSTSHSYVGADNTSITFEVANEFDGRGGLLVVLTLINGKGAAEQPPCLDVGDWMSFLYHVQQVVASLRIWPHKKNSHPCVPLFGLLHGTTMTVYPRCE
jgi:hypothetical protein